MARQKKEKKETVLSLETVLWNCRVALRGIGSTEKNRDAVIGLVFLKFAGDKFEKRRAELLEQHGNIPAFLEKASFYNAVNVFYLKKKQGGHTFRQIPRQTISPFLSTKQWRISKMITRRSLVRFPRIFSLPWAQIIPSSKASSTM